MTKRVNRPYKKTGRPIKVPPANAAARIAALAASGRSIIGIARLLNTSQDTLYRWMDEDPALAEAFAQGREIERFTLHNALYRSAKKGNIVAAMFLLKARHGYREGDQGDTAHKVSINFTLPAPLQPEQFTVIEHEETSAKTLPVPGKNLTRS